MVPQRPVRRALPSAFINRTTYGLGSPVAKSRLPEVPQGSKGELTEVLVGPPSYATRIALACLRTAEDAPVIARLVIGALVDASGVGYTKAGLNSPFVQSAWADRLKGWARERYLMEMDIEAGEDPSLPAGTEQGEPGQNRPATSESGLPAYPRDLLPRWMERIEVDDAELAKAMKMDAHEIAGYAGALAYAIAKAPTAENLQAFNERRRRMIENYLPSGALSIFVEDSPYLTLDLLSKVHRTFNSVSRDRALVMGAIVDADRPLISGPAKVFYNIFRLTAGTSLNPLLLIVKAVTKYPDLYFLFPDLETEFHAAADAIERFEATTEARRLYLKVIFGNDYIPVDRRDVDSLLGVSAFILKYTEPTLENYKGGTISAEHRSKVLRFLNLPEEQPEEVPERET